MVDDTQLPVAEQEQFDWIGKIEDELFPSLHPALVMGQDISHHCPSLMFGELSLETLAHALDVCRTKGLLPERGGSLCDVGCGIGRATYRAALLRSWDRCHGVEIYEKRYKLAVEALKRWKQHMLPPSDKAQTPSADSPWARARAVVGPSCDVGFTCGDVLELVEDLLLGYSVLLLVSAAFTDSLLSQMEEAFQSLPVGVLAICITKSIPGSRWREVHREETQEPWGRAVLIIQQKIS